MIVLSVNPENFDAVVKKAVRALRKGKVLVCPTDTVYGLIADATNAEAVRKIFQIKGREKGKPIPIFVKDIASARKLAKIANEKENFLKKVWPGKVTVVLPSKGKLPKELGTSKTIGLRIPNYDLIDCLLKALNKPLTGTSANLSGTPSFSDSKEIIAQFSRRKYAPDMVLDVGVLPPSLPSTVIDFTEDKKKILRK